MSYLAVPNYEVEPGPPKRDYKISPLHAEMIILFYAMSISLSVDLGWSDEWVYEVSECDLINKEIFKGRIS